LVIHLNLNCPDWSNVIKKSNVKCIAYRKNAFYPGIMTTIQVNEPTKAGKALIETARIMAEKYKGIEFIKDRDPDEKDLLKKMLTAYESRNLLAFSP
jgi:hypothetical protein